MTPPTHNRVGPTTEQRVVRNRLQYGAWTLVAGALATGLLIAQALTSGHGGFGAGVAALPLLTLGALPLLGIATHSQGE